VKRILLAALLLASCTKSGTPDLQISDAWARETVAGQTATAAYMTIQNRGAGDDRLISVEAPAPAKAMLHASESSDGVSRMREMGAGLALPAGAAVQLKPGGTHVMITGLGAPLRASDVMKLRLQFEKSGPRDIDVAVGAGGR
jgi:periplasmic copper chaperone A